MGPLTILSNYIEPFFILWESSPEILHLFFCMFLCLNKVYLKLYTLLACWFPFTFLHRNPRCRDLRKITYKQIMMKHHNDVHCLGSRSVHWSNDWLCSRQFKVRQMLSTAPSNVKTRTPSKDWRGNLIEL